VSRTYERSIRPDADGERGRAINHGSVSAVIRIISKFNNSERAEVIRQAKALDSKAEHEEFLRKARQAIARGHKLAVMP